MFEKQLIQLLNALMQGLYNPWGSGYKLTYQWKELDKGEWKLYQCSFHLCMNEINRRKSDFEFYEKEDYRWQVQIISVEYNPNWCESVVGETHFIKVIR